MELKATVATVNTLEAEVKVRQESLRAATDKAERIKAVLAVFEAEAVAAVTPDAHPPSPTATPKRPPRPRLADINQTGADRCRG